MATPLMKAIRSLVQFQPSTVAKASRGSLGAYTPNAPHEYGQPTPETLGVDAQGLISRQRMREVVMKTPTAAACMNATLDYAQGVKVALRNVDPSKKANPSQVAFTNNLMRRPNPNDTWRRFALKCFRDMFTLGFAAVEIEPDEDGNVANLWVVDAAKLFMDYDEHGTLLGYNMLDVHGMPIRKTPDSPYTWSPDQIILFEMNPGSNTLYSTSRVLQLFTCAVIEDLMLYFISTRFTDSNIPFGVFDIGDVSEKELRDAINSWNNQARAQHRIVMTGSKNGSKWYPFGYHLKDLEAVQLLAEVRGKIMAICGVTMQELGESQDINKSNGYNLSFTFKKRAIEPLLDEFTQTLTQRLLWDTLGFVDLEYYYEQIDSRDELLQAQIDESYFKMGVDSVDDIRNKKGKPNTDGGEIPFVFTGSDYIPVDSVEAFAREQLRGLTAVADETEIAVQQAKLQMEMMAAGGAPAPGQGKPQNLISPPLIRPPQPPEKMTTPGGRGSSTTKIKYPRADITNANTTGMQSQGKQPNGNPQKPRGKVQALRNHAGIRKEDQ
jgi:hypothetical protein